VKVPGVDETSRVNGSRNGGLQAYWEAEGATLTASKAKFRRVELELRKLTALTYATDELLSDATALGAWVSSVLPAELIFKLEDAIINGTGAGTPLGILNGGALVSQAAESAQTADTVNEKNVLKMFARLPVSSRPSAVWFINQDVEPQLPQMVIGEQPVYLPPGGLVGTQPFGTLLGRPVIPVEQCATVGDVGDIILADMSQYYLARKGGIRADTSIHVKFTTDEQAFRFIMRVDGQPAWMSAITPFKGSNTLSPFVTLAAR
jgi:HK97 family phage major capsid protein